MFPEPLLPPGQSFRGLKEALPYATCAIHGSQTALMHRLEGLWTPSGYVQAIDHYGVAMQSALHSSSLGSPGNDTLSFPCPARWHRVSIKPIVKSRRGDSNRENRPSRNGAISRAAVNVRSAPAPARKTSWRARRWRQNQGAAPSDTQVARGSTRSSCCVSTMRE